MKKIKMQFKKSTKGTHVFECLDDDAAISTLYVKRSAMGENPPKAIEVEIKTCE